MDGKVATSRPLLLLLLFCVQQMFVCCQTRTYSVLGSNDKTVLVGGNLTLTCNFSEPVNASMTWALLMHQRDNVYIGRCRKDGTCVKYLPFVNDSRFAMVQDGGQIFQLSISDLSITDSGEYECGLETESYQPLHVIHVEVTTSPILTMMITENNKIDQQSLPSTEETTQTNVMKDGADSIYGR